MPLLRRAFPVLAVAVATSLQAQAFPPPLALPEKRPVEVLLVGVFHFAQEDTLRFDILSPKRQQEVQAFIREVAKFRPTKVMVEWQPYFQQRRIDSTYALYRRGSYPLPRNEVFQLGYRLANEARLDRVWAIDHPGFWLGDSARIIATAMGQLPLLDGTAPFVHPEPGDAIPRDSMFARATVGQMLRWMSSPTYQALMYDNYVNRLARVGIVPGDDFDTQENEVGAELLAEWLKRNVKIYRHVLARTDYAAGDRIVIFIGADHVRPLRDLFAANLNFRVVELDAYAR